MTRWAQGVIATALLLLSPPAGAEMVLPAGFTAQVYVTGEGFDGGAGRGTRGIPATSTPAVTISRNAWPVNEVVRISGPFDELVRQRQGVAP